MLLTPSASKKLIRDHFFYMQVDPAAAGALYDKEFIVCALDLLSGLAEGLGAGIESLVNSTIWPVIFPFFLLITLCSLTYRPQ